MKSPDEEADAFHARRVATMGKSNLHQETKAMVDVAARNIAEALLDPVSVIAFIRPEELRDAMALIQEITCDLIAHALEVGHEAVAAAKGGVA